MKVSKFDRCYVYGGVADLRKGAPGLSALIGQPEDDVLYLFSNRRRNLIKFLSVDKWGIWVGTRRLHHKRFYWPDGRTVIDFMKMSLGSWLVRLSRLNER